MDSEQRRHLARLAEVLARHEFRAELTAGDRPPALKIGNPDIPALSERAFCRQAADGTWCYWWPWRQPIGSVDDLENVAAKIIAVLRAVEGEE